MHLQKLDLSSCSNLRTLPSRMYQMTSLTSLDLRACPKLQQIPRAIRDEKDKKKCAAAVLDFLRKANSTSVRRVNLFGESISSLRSLLLAHLFPSLSPAVLGHGGAGKTTLLQAIAAPAMKLEKLPDTPSTIGIDVPESAVINALEGASQRSSCLFEWSTVVAHTLRPNQGKGKEKTIAFNVWDFAGQLEYLTTHQFFITVSGSLSALDVAPP